jgi:hypothetical protein
MEEKEKNSTQTIGSLFGTIHYVSINDLDNFISNLNQEQSLYCLIEAVRLSHSKGVFTIEESECISKAIRVFQKNSEQ